ncbi:MAG: 5'-methylthioadenosine/adenosylhomocysteine nucleosidase [Clostridia bacterium]|nr:5'-methylthioadenosine/adenosylhomocysteine nucleosidase [Clostridia bacterium]
MKYKKIGIIGAMDKEVEDLVALIEDRKEVKVLQNVFYTGKIGKYEVVVTKSGVGKVFAAAGTQTMIMAFNPDCIINMGIAGSLSSRVGIMDVVIGKKLTQYDYDTTAVGDPKSFIQEMGITHVESDAELVDTISQVTTSLSINHVVGTIVSGDTFIADMDKKRAIHEEYDADACEMEGAAIATICAYQNIPFCIVRTLSDGGDSNSHMDYPKFKVLASKQSISIILELLNKF